MEEKEAAGKQGPGSNDNNGVDAGERDTIYADPVNPVPPFRFDRKVARVFPDMIKRSVPGYQDIIEMIGLFARHFVQAGSICYDLGASLGAATLAMRRNIIAEDCRIIAVDNSRDMLARCAENLAWDQSRTPVDTLLSDLEDVRITNAGMVVLNFTLQFIAPERRQRIIDNIYRGLRPGGILILSEKLNYGDNPVQQEIMTDLHLDFKRMNGYSDLEISQKRQSLENVLISNSHSELTTMFRNAGFNEYFEWFRFFTFSSMFARKGNEPPHTATGDRPEDRREYRAEHQADTPAEEQ